MKRKPFERIDNEISKIYFSRKARREQLEKNNSNKYAVIKKFLLPPEKANTILECGGGAGFYTKKFLGEGYNVTCVDLSEDALNKNKENANKIGKGSNLKTFSGDFIFFCKNTPEKFDQILFIKVFHHFDSLENIYKALDSAREHCKPGGRVIIFEPNGKNKLWKLILSIKKDKATGEPKWFYEQNMKFTITTNFSSYFRRRQLSYKLGYHYVIPSLILNRFPKSPVLSSLNRLLENTFLRKYAFNISVIYNQF